MCWSWSVGAAAVLLAAAALAACEAREHRSASWAFYHEHAPHLRHHRDHVRQFSCGHLYYRTFYLDEKRHSLFVGAMDRIFKLSLRNISQSHCEKDSLNSEPSHVANCVSKGKSEHFDCRNHIRVIQPMGDGTRLYVCGTNAHFPKDWVIYANLTHLSRRDHVPGVGTGVAKCPYDPADNSTAVWVERGNPGGLPGLYSGTNAEFTKADTVIFRTDLHNLTTGRREFSFKRTLKYDSKWLDKPNFVGSFDVGEHVLFFFREPAMEYINCGKRVYSRVARVCKRDTGGKNILSQNWATFLKARLNCSLPGEFPFYFDEIQDVYRIPGEGSRFYATFTTASTGLVGSAVCAYTLRDVQQAFRGRFKEQATSSSAWLPFPSGKVPEPRPGECVNDTQTLPDVVLNFIRSHPLMDESVAHEGGRPVFYRGDVVFTKLAVHRLKVDLVGTHKDFTVYYIGSNTGQVHKVVQWTDRDGRPMSRELDVFDVTPSEPIRAMEISRQYGSLYVASDGGVRQLALEACARRYDSCLRCARDPYCGWDRADRRCRAYSPGLLQDVTESRPGICDGSAARRVLAATWGQSVHLGCFHRVPRALRGHHFSWTHTPFSPGALPAPIAYSRSDKYVETSEHGLVVLSVTEADAGRYDCWLGGSLLCALNVTVDAYRCAAPTQSRDYRQVYSDWCREFDKYRRAMQAWQERKAVCDSRQSDNQQRSVASNNVLPEVEAGDDGAR
ncbi:semaphorin-2A-like [Schistocerca americana]|uniref:semaphorin-2A-like n=1 Tax=Schistocerca americana TaxID=7009 RepID=UPI001F4FDCBA|nr:semaphorin-2A-like [Schistocerca americana]